MKAHVRAGAIFMAECTITVHATMVGTGISRHFYRMASK